MRASFIMKMHSERGQKTKGKGRGAACEERLQKLQQISEHHILSSDKVEIHIVSTYNRDRCNSPSTFPFPVFTWPGRDLYRVVSSQYSFFECY